MSLEERIQKRKISDFPPKILYENRYCKQDDFSILACGGKDRNKTVVNKVFKLDGLELKCKEYTLMP